MDSTVHRAVLWRIPAHCEVPGKWSSLPRRERRWAIRQQHQLQREEEHHQGSLNARTMRGWLPPVVQRAASCPGKTAHKSQRTECSHVSKRKAGAFSNLPMWSRRPNHEAYSPEMSYSPAARRVTYRHSIDYQTLRLQTRAGEKREKKKTNILTFITRTTQRIKQEERAHKKALKNHCMLQ